MVKQLLLVVLFIAACRKHEEPAPTATPTHDEQTQPRADTSPAKSSGSKQTGPGFTVIAPGAATVEKGPFDDGLPDDDVYTFKIAGKERYEVRIHPVRADQNGLQAASIVRDKIVFTAAVKLNEDDVAEGNLRGFDLRYKTDKDDAHLFVRSWIVSDDKNVFHVRAVYPKKDQEEAADAFVDSFAVTPSQ
ncbi:hypothetical protein BH11MYX2_BH11MYX2_05580 [soil metagenome]